MQHKFSVEEKRAQKSIKKSGFTATLQQSGARISGPDYSPIFAQKTVTKIYAADVSNDAEYRSIPPAVRYDKTFLVSTENIILEKSISVGDTVLIAALLSQFESKTFKVMEVSSIQPGGVPIIYILKLSGGTDA